MSFGLVLSGGAAYGLANAGVLHVFERENLIPDYVAGSSMGAIVGALYAYTGKTDVLRELIGTLTLWNIAGLSDHPLQSGLHGGMFRQHLEEHLQSVLGDATIGDCAIPFVCIAGKVIKPIEWTSIIKPGFMDVVRESVEPCVFPAETRLIDAIMASSAIPVIFSPVTIGDDTFIDLVHFGAIPARTLRELHKPDVIIATDTTPRYDKLKSLLPASWKEFLAEGYEELEQSKAACDLILQPEPAAAVFRFDKASAFVEAGSAETEKRLAEIRSLLTPKVSP